MGYRSDVKYVLLFKTAEGALKAKALAELEFSELDYGHEILSNMENHVVPETDFPYRIQVHYEDVKWYETDPWVRAQENFIQQFDSSDEQHVFVRLGEDYSDYETLESKDVYVSDYIDYHRSTEFV